MCSHLIFTAAFSKSHYPNLYSEDTGAWRVLGNLPKVTMLLSKKFNIQNSGLCTPQPSVSSAFLCCFSKMNRMWSLFPESSQPGGHEILTVRQAFGDGQKHPFQLGL